MQGGRSRHTIQISYLMRIARHERSYLRGRCNGTPRRHRTIAANGPGFKSLHATQLTG
jgi:hypothetical protein